MTSRVPLSISAFLGHTGWLGNPGPDPGAVSFLAAGEYNSNYLVRAGGRSHVFRINHGSQLGLDNQIEYEFGVLKALENSGVTPRPYFYSLPTNDQALWAELGQGVLLMEYLPGGPLDYQRHMDHAARIFAAVHSQPTAEGLVVQADPVGDIAKESMGLITRFPDHPLQEKGERLLAFHEQIVEMGRQTRDLFAAEELVVVNTEVNSHNFLIHESGPGPVQATLVDWEKAVVSHRYQDLGHFLVATTTRWKSDYVYSVEEKQSFLRKYLDSSGLELSLEHVARCTEVLERTILLRALSWCYMAYYEYTQADRALQNQDTFAKITTYLDELEWIVAS
ncbi:MAG: aminoglycoside phosphotransferase family protein [Desulfovibrio sp.]|nr:MAG: aminoglycoside phosphotransferase family protein [Desulfovibrio sp.]